MLDDHSRVIAGYMVFLGAPSALNTSLALRQAIWRQADPVWPVCSIPDVLCVDHGSDFTSLHLEQAAADLRLRLIYSAVARPQGRGKIERLFRTIDTELLAELPGNLRNGKPVSPPRLTLPGLNAAIGAYIVAIYNVRPHRAIGVPPVDAWRGDGWLAADAGNIGGTGLAAGHGRQISHRPPRRHPFRGAALFQSYACRLCRRAGDDPLRSA
nr:DDE-type integrase/transposase/recombinase [Xanthomonas theicola]